MHPYLNTKAAQRRRAPAVAARTCMMHMTLETGAITALRTLVMRVCGEALQFMRIEACAHGSRMRVWLCVSQPFVAMVMEAVSQNLPSTEFGRFSGKAARRDCA